MEQLKEVLWHSARSSVKYTPFTAVTKPKPHHSLGIKDTYLLQPANKLLQLFFFAWSRAVAKGEGVSLHLEEQTQHLCRAGEAQSHSALATQRPNMNTEGSELCWVLRKTLQHKHNQHAVLGREEEAREEQCTALQRNTNTSGRAPLDSSPGPLTRSLMSFSSPSNVVNFPPSAPIPSSNSSSGISTLHVSDCNRDPA